MEKKVKKSAIPTKDALITKLMEIVEGYDGTEETPVRPTDAIRAIEVLNRMLGFNEADKSEIGVKELRFEL